MLSRFEVFILSSTLTLAIGACGMGGKPQRPRERKPQDKMWRPCEDFETASPVGKLCNRTCKERKRPRNGELVGKCKKWKTHIKDFSKKEDFLFFRNGSMVMIDEDQIL